VRAPTARKHRNERTWRSGEENEGHSTKWGAQSEPEGQLGRPCGRATLQLLSENVRDYAIMTMDLRGNITGCNSAAGAMNGYTSNEIHGKHISVFYPPEEIAGDKVKHELETAATAGRYEDEDWRVRKDGSRYWANIIVTALHDENRKLRGFGKIVRDLSERKRAEDLVRHRSDEIIEAAVPVVQVWEGILLVPLIGTLDSSRTQQLMERLLKRITETSSEVALLDITGVPAIDTQTAQHLVETIKAVRYVGSDIVLTGVRPAIAQTLVHLGVDLDNVSTRSSLRAGLSTAFEMMGLRIVSGKSGGEKVGSL
jgi:rsbT co-antagonist protein RsbR